MCPARVFCFSPSIKICRVLNPGKLASRLWVRQATVSISSLAPELIRPLRTSPVRSMVICGALNEAARNRVARGSGG